MAPLQVHASEPAGRSAALDIPFAVVPWAVVLAVTASTAMGVAARLAPIDALRAP